MHGIKGVVNVEHDPLRHLPERGAIEVDHRPPHRDQLPHAGQVLQPAHRRLGGQIPTRRQRILGHLEDRIGSQPVGVVAVLVAGGDHLHAKADHVGQAVGGLVRTARIVDAARQTPPAAAFPPRPEPERRCWTTACRRRNGRRRTCRPLMTNQRQRRIIHGGCGLREMIRIDLSNKILRHFNGLHHIRQPAMNFSG